MKVNRMITSTEEQNLEIVGVTLLEISDVKVYLSLRERAYPYKWWLANTGSKPGLASCVDTDGLFYRGRDLEDGQHTYIECSVRPALIIKDLEKTNFYIGDTFALCGYEFKIISDRLAWMYNNDIGNCAYSLNLYDDSNIYSKSDVKKYVDKWFYSKIFSSELCEDCRDKFLTMMQLNN